MSTDINQVMVVGAGTMGAGIAQVCAAVGCQVALTDLDEGQLERAGRGIESSLNRLAAKNKLTDEPETILGRISFEQSVEKNAAGADLVVEAVFEDLAVKQKVLAEVGRHAAREALVASNTSAISITVLAAEVPHPDRVLGLHFFNPVPLLKAVEVVRGLETSDESMEKTVAFIQRLGRSPIRVDRDVPGFLLNRINLPSNLEAMRLVEQGVGAVEDIDRGVKLAFGRPMGIFEVGDLVGLDVTLMACEAIYAETKDPKYLPPVILRRMVAAGRLGRKTGRGWYSYDEDGTRKP